MPNTITKQEIKQKRKIFEERKFVESVIQKANKLQSKDILSDIKSGKVVRDEVVEIYKEINNIIEGLTTVVETSDVRNYIKELHGIQDAVETMFRQKQITGAEKERIKRLVGKVTKIAEGEFTRKGGTIKKGQYKLKEETLKGRLKERLKKENLPETLGGALGLLTDSPGLMLAGAWLTQKIKEKKAKTRERYEKQLEFLRKMDETRRYRLKQQISAQMRDVETTSGELTRKSKTVKESKPDIGKLFEESGGDLSEFLRMSSPEEWETEKRIREKYQQKKISGTPEPTIKKSIRPPSSQEMYEQVGGGLNEFLKASSPEEWETERKIREKYSAPKQETQQTQELLKDVEDNTYQQMRLSQETNSKEDWENRDFFLKEISENTAALVEEQEKNKKEKKKEKKSDFIDTLTKPGGLLGGLKALGKGAIPTGAGAGFGGVGSLLGGIAGGAVLGAPIAALGMYSNKKIKQISEQEDIQISQLQDDTETTLTRKRVERWKDIRSKIGLNKAEEAKMRAKVVDALGDDSTPANIVKYLEKWMRQGKFGAKWKDKINQIGDAYIPQITLPPSETKTNLEKMRTIIPKEEKQDLTQEPFNLANSRVDVSGLQPDLYSALVGVGAEYKDKTGKNLTITSGFRSSEEQANLYAKFPDKAAPPGRSLHEYGWAFDANSEDLNKIDQMGLLRKYGLHRPFLRPPPGRKKEPWHVQPKGISLASVSNRLSRARECDQQDSPKEVGDAYMGTRSQPTQPPGSPIVMQQIMNSEDRRITIDDLSILMNVKSLLFGIPE